MMLHRHFEENNNHNLTTLADVTPHREKFVSEVFPPEEKISEEQPKRKGRPKKTAE